MTRVRDAVIKCHLLSACLHSRYRGEGVGAGGRGHRETAEELLSLVV